MVKLIDLPWFRGQQGEFSGGGVWGCNQQPVEGWPCPCTQHQGWPCLASTIFLQTLHCFLLSKRTLQPKLFVPLQMSSLFHVHHQAISLAPLLAPTHCPIISKTQISWVKIRPHNWPWWSVKITWAKSVSRVNFMSKCQSILRSSFSGFSSYLRDGSIARKSPSSFLHSQGRWAVGNAHNSTPVQAKMSI